jgi:hypothetical protein
MELSTLNDLVLRTEMPIGDESLTIFYRLGALGPEFDTWLASPDGGGRDNSLYEAVARVCVSTGITVGGEPVPCTGEAMQAAKIPPQVLKAILAHVRSEARVGKLGVSIWPPGLLPGASSASAPTGTS